VNSRSRQAHELLAVRQQSDSNAYLPPFSTQRPPEKPRPFQPATSYPPPSQNDVTSYPVQRPSSLYVPPNAGFPTPAKPTSPRPSFPGNQQPSTTYVPQGFGGSTSYNPRPSQPSYANAGSSAFPPLNPEASSTYLPPQPPSFPSSSPRPPLSSSTILSVSSPNGFSIGGGGVSSTEGYPSTGGGGGGYSPSGFRPSSSGYPSERPTPSFPTPSTNAGYPSTGYPSSTTSGYPSTTRKPFPPFTDESGRGSC